MNNRDKLNESFSFLIDDGLKPSLIVHLNGDILHENGSFKYLSANRDSNSITDLLDNESSEAWRSYIAKVLVSKYTLTGSFPISIRLDEQYDGLINLFSPAGSQVVVAKMTLSSGKNILPLKEYINAFNQSSNPMAIVDNGGIIRDLNLSFVAFFNMPKEELVDSNMSAMVKLIDSLSEFDTSSFLEKVRIKGFHEYFQTYQHSASDIRHYHITTYYDEETTMFFVEMEDYTEKENLQLQLAHSGSLSAVGQIAASIAHEIRNPITTLKGFTQLLKASATDESIRYISVIEDEIDRMESILSEMLLLSKPSIKKKTIFSLERLICDMISLLHPKAVMEEIEIDKRFNTENDSFLHGDSDKIKQVLFNLFKNALESMSKGGILSIELNEKDGNLILSIKDTGKGMTRHQVNQVFMPFFSSKAGGTGLGLPFVLKTVEEHGGTIAVESQIEKGTNFILTFAKMSQEAKSEIPENQTILL